MAILRAFTSNRGTASTYTVAKPAGTLPGDVLIAFQTSAAFGNTGMTTPTGGAAWSLLGQLAASEWGGTRVWWKIAGASEPSSYTFKQSTNPFSGAYDGIAAVVAIADHSGATPLIGLLNNGPDSSITAPSVSSSLTSGVTLRWAAALSSLNGTWTAPAGHTKLFERAGEETRASLASRTRTAAGATGSATYTWSASAPAFSQGITVDVGGTAVPPPEPEPAIPPSKDIHYRYVFTDLLTDEFITTLDLSDVSYDRRILEPGAFSATIPIPSAGVAEKVAAIIPRYPEDLSTGPGRTVVHVYRNGLMWGSYLIWSATIEQSERGGLSARISGATLESYLNHVEIREDLEYASEDQVEIGRSLLSSMQAQSHADIGLTMQSGTSGVDRDRTYLASETATFGQRLTELAQVNNGFEWIIQTSDPGTGTRVREWQWGYPTLGNEDTEHVFTQPGNVISWSEEVDAIRGGTSFVVRGESSSDDLSTASEPTLSSVVDATAHFAAGWPRLDVTVTAHSVRVEETLDAYAARWAAASAGAVRVHQVTIRLDGDDFTPANLGDRARVVLVNDWWPRVNGGASFDQSWRVIGIAVQATARGQRETAQLVLEEVAE